MQCPYCKEEVLPGAVKCKHCGSTIGGVPGQTVVVGNNDFGELFNRAVNAWKAQFVDLLILTLVFMLIVWIPIANIGFIAGYTRSLIKVARGEGKAQVGDLFNAWDCFGNLFIYCVLYFLTVLILHFIPILGSLATIALGFVVAPGIYAIIDKQQSAMDALKWGIDSIQRNFVPWLLAYLVGSIISGAGVLLIGIGVIITAPLGALIIINQYESVK